MRAGVYTIHQSLTAEAAAVLKLALALASRRGHAQVTPLHVAFALLGSSCALQQHPQPPGGARAAAYGLLRRACLRSSHPASATVGAAQQHPLQCRALELCFNVALNRLSTSGPHSPPPSSSSGAPFASSLIQPSPTLSNALVAALKRAQANQRRGCVELQQPPPVTLQQQQGALQQQQPLLAIKVELDQLIISILDDPSVSRVMREAGFSSATVKANLEEESAALMCMTSSSPSPPPPVIPPHFFLDHRGIGNTGGSSFGMWPPQFLSSPPPYCNERDVRAVLEVMVRKQGRRTNPVVVGDSVSMAEAVAGELLRRLERGEVPEELAGAHLLKLQLSYVHVRLMTRADVDAKASELRRTVDAVQLQRGGLVVYVGDLRWALDEDPASGADHTASSYSPVEHMVAELGRLLDDLRASGGRVLLVATASYQTYMRCQQRRGQPSLETSWALQAVAVPTGSGTGLALNNLHSSSSPSATAMQQAMTTGQQLAQSPFAMATEAMALGGDHEDKLLLCSECNRNYEREASVVKPEPVEEGPRLGLPAWLVLDNKPPVDHQMPHKDTSYLIELKRKWSRLCRKLHLWNSQQHDPYSASCFGSGLSASPSSWWPSSCLPPSSQNRPSIAGFLGLEGLMEQGRSSSRWSPPSPLPCPGLMQPECQDAKTALGLGTFPLSDTASSDGHSRGSDDGLARELERRLRKNIPWQPAGTVAQIVEAVAGGRSYGRKGVWLFLKGTDHAAQQRAVAMIAETCSGSADQIIAADPRKFSCAEDFCSDVVSRACKIGSNKFVLVIHDVEHAPRQFVEYLVAVSAGGSSKGHFGQELDLSESVVLLTSSEFANGASDVISLRLRTSSLYGDVKRKAEIEQPSREYKRARHDAGRHGIDLNLCAGNDSDDDDGVPSDITHESGTKEHGRPHDILESIAAVVLTLDKGADADHRAVAAIRAVLVGALGREVQLEDEAAEALAAASGYFLGEVLERWAAEVFEPAAAAVVENGGKVVILGIGPGGGARVSGFMGSALPSRVLVD